jgi:hypothetical protein
MGAQNKYIFPRLLFIIVSNYFWNIVHNVKFVFAL